MKSYGILIRLVVIKKINIDVSKSERGIFFNVVDEDTCYYSYCVKYECFLVI